MDLEFWLFLLLSFSAFITLIFIPGWSVIHHLKVKPISSLVLSFALGITFLGLQGFVLGYLNLRFLSYVYLLYWLMYAYQHHSALSRYGHELKRQLLALSLLQRFLILAGSVIQLIVIFPSGLLTRHGLTFYQINAHDGVFHLAMIQALIRRFPPIEPGASGLVVTNYHYWSNLVMAELARLFALPVTHLYFQYIPLLLAPLLGLAVYATLITLTKSPSVAAWGLFFHYFSGDLNYLFMLIVHKTFSFTTVTLDNGAIQFINMPQAFAKFLFLAGILSLVHEVKKPTRINRLTTLLLLSVTVGFKVYFGIAAAFAYSLVQIYRLGRNFIHTRQLKSLVTSLVYLLLFAIIAAIIYFPVNANSGGIYFVPLTWPKLLLAFDKLDWREWWLRLQVYEAAGNTKALVFMYTLAVSVFMGAIYSFRLLGFIPIAQKKLPPEIILFLYPATFVFTIIGMNFLQVSGGHNIFNFFIVALTLLTLTTPIFLGWLKLVSPKFHLILAIIIVTLTLPRILYTSYKFAQSAIVYTDATSISPGELEGLEFLRKNANKDAVIQGHLNNYLEGQTPYLSYFTNRNAYYGGWGILNSHKQPVTARESIMKIMNSSGNYTTISYFLNYADIDYLILQKGPDFQAYGRYTKHPDLSVFFENDVILILKRQ